LFAGVIKGECKFQVINFLKKASKNIKIYLEWEGLSFYICTPQEYKSSVFKLNKKDLEIKSKNIL
jgi:hypothetical protein